MKLTRIVPAAMNALNAPIALFTRATTLALAAAVGAAVVAPISPAGAQPDAVYINANVYTVDPNRPRAEAFAVEGGAFTLVGSAAQARAAAGANTRVVDLGGLTVLPGLIDAHGHLDGLGALATGVVDLSGARSEEEMIALVRAKAAQTPRRAWVVGRGWDNESWPVKALPSHHKLSEAVPDHPVWLGRVDGHAALANAMAMTFAEITRATPNPPGGEILKDRAGEPTGVFVDHAESLVERVIPPEARGDARRRLLAAQEALLAAGITGAHDMGTAPATVRLLQELERSGELKLRVQAVLPAGSAADWFENNGVIIGERLSARSAKYYMDGAMGSRGAWLLAPYEDRPGTAASAYFGLQLMETDRLERAAVHAARHGYQLCTHAIGDRANREVLDAYERAARSVPGFDLASARFRVEHAQLLHPEDIARFSALGVIPSMQPKHATSDMRWVEARVGTQRALGAYAWGSLVRSGSTIAAGSDFPVEPYNPFLGFYAAVTRQDETASPEEGWLPEQRLTREEALAAFTLWAAHAAFDESRLGSISPGKRADFIVIDRDIMTEPAPVILGARVERTVIEGETVFSRH